jgi:[ribosomal protein S5]-alanine N-acetyltransferase
VPDVAGRYLETPRLLLRPMQATDVDALLVIFSDPRVMSAFDVPPFNRQRMSDWVQRNLDHQATHGYGLYTVILKSNGLLIGDCGLERMDVDGRPVVELGFDFRSDHWNRGYATEAAIAVKNLAFEALGLVELSSLIRVGNHASRRVAEKTGMSLAGEIVRHGQRYWHYTVHREAAIPA